MIKIGDRVKFLSDTSVGVVTKIHADIVFVDVEEGFEIPVDISDLVVVNKQDELDAIQRIGMEDDKPGAKKAIHGAKLKKEEPKIKDRAAYAKYGKVSLVDSSEDEDYQDILDMDRIKEQYIKGLIAVQKKEQEFEQQELINKQEKSKVIQQSIISIPEEKQQQKPQSITIDELSQKIKNDIAPSQPIKPEKQPAEIEVVDLHAQEIIESTAGMTNGEILTLQLARFTFALDMEIKRAKHGKMVFIHGVGKGRLRYEIEKVLKLNYPKLKYQDASFKEYGYGAVIIYF